MRCWFPRSGQIPSKVVGKYKEIFFFGLILVGSLPKLKFLKGEKFSKAISNLVISRWPSI